MCGSTNCSTAAGMRIYFNLREDTMNGAMWAKIAKAIIAVGAVAGIQIEPDQLELIAQGAGSVLAIIYAIEARLKSGNG